MTLADFTAAAHLSSLDYINDVDWKRSATVHGVVFQDKIAASLSHAAADQIPGFQPPAHYADLDF